MKHKIKGQSRYASQRGFTLVELLLGLTIFSFIVLSIYSIFWGGIRLSQHSEKQSDLYREARWAFMVISQDLERMVPYNFQNSYPERAPCDGKKDEITFLVPSEDGLRVVSYHLLSPDWGQKHITQLGRTSSKNVAVLLTEENPQRANYLVRKERPLADFLNNDLDEYATVEILSTHVKENGLRFFFGYLEGEESSRSVWKDAWANAYIPSNVKVEIDFLAEGKEGNVLTLHRDVLVPPGFWGGEESS